MKRAKAQAWAEDLLRYNPRYYSAVRRMISEVVDMDMEERGRLTERLTARVVGWACVATGFNRDVLADWPILEKAVLRTDAERYRRRGIFAVPAETSGTTGIPIRLWRSLECVAAEQAFIDSLLEPEWPRFCDARIAVLRGDSIKDPSDRSPPFGYVSHRGRRLILSGQHVSRHSTPWYAEAIKEYQPDFLFAHPSACEALAKHMLDLGVSCRVPMVLTSSEVFRFGGRSLVERTFEARTIDYYGLAERVCFASSMRPGVYYFNPVYGRVELQPVPGEIEPGFSSAEIVATGFWNKAMPLVRYRTGDHVLIPTNYSAKDLEAVALGIKPFDGILGREDQVLKTASGETLLAISQLPRETRNIVRMQVIQEREDLVLINIIPDRDFCESDLATLRHNVKRKIPGEITVKIQCVKELERLPNGKVPYVIRKFERPAAGSRSS